MAAKITWVVRLIGLSTPITERETGGTLQTNGSANNNIRQVISRRKLHFLPWKTLSLLIGSLYNSSGTSKIIPSTSQCRNLSIWQRRHCSFIWLGTSLCWNETQLNQSCYFLLRDCSVSDQVFFLNTYNVCKKAIPSAHWSISRKLKYARNPGNRIESANAKWTKLSCALIRLRSCV